MGNRTGTSASEETDRQIKERILSTAYELFRKQGVQSVTMDEIARALGMSKKTLYAHYDSKSSILFHALSRRMEQSELIRKKILDEAPNVIDGMITLMLWQIQELEKLNPVFFVDVERYFPESSRLIRMNREVDYYGQVTALIRRGIDEGLILDDLDVDIISRLLLVQLDHMSNYDLFPLSSYPRATLFRHIFILFIRGIVTGEGADLLARTMDRLEIKRSELSSLSIDSPLK